MKSKIFKVSRILGFICVLLAIGSLASDVIAEKEIIMKEDFEAGSWISKWSFSGDPSWYRQLYGAEPCISPLPDSGFWNAWCAEYGTSKLTACEDEYPNNCDAWIVHGPFNLSEPVGEVKVEFDLWNKSETGDYFKFMASTSPLLSDFQALYQTQSNLEWEHIKLALDGDTAPDIDNNAGNPDFRGNSQVWIAVVFQSNDDDNTNIGAFIDNIELWKRMGAPEIEVTPRPYDYGKVLVSTCSKKTFTVKNTGSWELKVTQILLENGTDEFKISDSPGVPFTLNPGQVQNVSVDFCPDLPLGDKSSDLCFDSNALKEPNYCVPLTGTSAAPQIVVNPPSWDFGTVRIGEFSQEKDFEVTNAGNWDLTVNAITLEPCPEGDYTSQFEIINLPDVPFTIQPEIDPIVTVRFSPTSIGEKCVFLRFQSGDSENPILDVSLVGNGSETPFHVEPTNRLMSFWGSAAIAGEPVEEGDMIGAFAPGVEINNGCVGVFEVVTPGEYVMHVYGDDGTTPEKDGAEEGDEITFEIWDLSEDGIYVAISQGPGSNIWSEDSSQNVNLDSLPSSPPYLRGTVGNERVELEWGSVPEAEGYKVYRSLNNIDYSSIADVGAQLTYTDTSVKNGVDYYYRVKSYVDGVESYFSHMVKLTPPFSAVTTNRSAVFKGNAHIGGEPATAGDILAAFVNLGKSLICVGTYEFPVSNGKYDLMWVYGDNPNTPEKDGAEEGDEVVFQVWDASANEILDGRSEPDVVLWHEDTTSYVDLRFGSDTPSGFNLHMCERWNLISFPIAKCYYEGTPPDANILPMRVDLVNISDLGFEHLADWFTSVLTADCGVWGPENPPWRRVISGLPGGAALVMDSEVPSSFHTLKFISPGYAYWVKIKDGTCGATLTLNGSRLACNTPLDYLQEGWNYIGYLADFGFYDTGIPNEDSLYVTPQIWEEKSAPVADHVLQSILGKYRMVRGASCGGEAILHDPTIPSQFSTLHFFAVGNGYLLKLYEDTTLTYPCDSATTVPRRLVLRRKQKFPDGLRPTWSSMFLYGTVSIGGKPAPTGSKIKVFTENGILCGVGAVDKDGLFGFLPVYGNDLTTSEMGSARAGEKLSVTVNGATADAGMPLRWLGQHAIQAVNLTVEEEDIPVAVSVGQNHPNPFNPETWIPYALPEAANVMLQIYSINGQLVRTLNLGVKPAGLYEIKGRAAYWDGRNDKGEKVSSGVYFYRFAIEGTSMKTDRYYRFSQIKRMVLLK